MTNQIKQSDFVAYIEKSVVNRIMTAFFRHTGMLPDTMSLDVRRIEEAPNEEHLRLEGDMKDDFWRASKGTPI